MAGQGSADYTNPTPILSHDQSDPSPSAGAYLYWQIDVTETGTLSIDGLLSQEVGGGQDGSSPYCDISIYTLPGLALFDSYTTIDAVPPRERIAWVVQPGESYLIETFGFSYVDPGNASEVILRTRINTASGSTYDPPLLDGETAPPSTGQLYVNLSTEQSSPNWVSVCGTGGEVYWVHDNSDTTIYRWNGAIDTFVMDPWVEMGNLMIGKDGCLVVSHWPETAGQYAFTLQTDMTTKMTFPTASVGGVALYHEGWQGLSVYDQTNDCYWMSLDPTQFSSLSGGVANPLWAKHSTTDGSLISVHADNAVFPHSAAKTNGQKTQIHNGYLYWTAKYQDGFTGSGAQALHRMNTSTYAWEWCWSYPQGGTANGANSRWFLGFDGDDLWMQWYDSVNADVWFERYDLSALTWSDHTSSTAQGLPAYTNRWFANPDEASGQQAGSTGRNGWVTIEDGTIYFGGYNNGDTSVWTMDPATGDSAQLFAATNDYVFGMAVVPGGYLGHFNISAVQASPDWRRIHTHAPIAGELVARPNGSPYHQNGNGIGEWAYPSGHSHALADVTGSGDLVGDELDTSYVDVRSIKHWDAVGGHHIDDIHAFFDFNTDPVETALWADDTIWVRCERVDASPAGAVTLQANLYDRGNPSDPLCIVGTTPTITATSPTTVGIGIGTQVANANTPFNAGDLTVNLRINSDANWDTTTADGTLGPRVRVYEVWMNFTTDGVTWKPIYANVAQTGDPDWYTCCSHG